MGIYADAINNGHTVHLRAVLNGVLSGVSSTVLSSSSESERGIEQIMQWEGMDYCIRDKNTIIAVGRDEEQYRRNDLSLQDWEVEIPHSTPAWHHRFDVVDWRNVTRDEAEVIKGILSIVDMREHFREALTQREATSYKEDFPKGFAVRELILSIPFMELSQALFSACRDNSSQIGYHTEVTSMEIETEPLFAR